jgi:hypothetical protein
LPVTNLSPVFEKQSIGLHLQQQQLEKTQQHQFDAHKNNIIILIKHRIVPRSILPAANLLPVFEIQIIRLHLQHQQLEKTQQHQFDAHKNKVIILEKHRIVPRSILPVTNLSPVFEIKIIRLDLQQQQLEKTQQHWFDAHKNNVIILEKYRIIPRSILPVTNLLPVFEIQIIRLHLQQQQLEKAQQHWFDAHKNNVIHKQEQCLCLLQYTRHNSKMVMM